MRQSPFGGPIRRLALAVVALAGAGHAAATDPEVRTFAVSVGGTPAGTCTMTFETAADGGETARVAAEAKGRVLFVPFYYAHQSKETWAGGRLTAVESTTNDDGKKKALTAVAAGAGFAVTIKGRTRIEKADGLPSSGWRRPAADGPVVLFDTEDGTRADATATDFGPCRVTVAGRPIAGTKYKLAGKTVDAEWWFDAAGRPIRQANVWDGQKVVLELTSVK